MLSAMKPYESTLRNYIALSVLLAWQVPGVVFHLFYKVLGLPGPSGKGLKHSSLKEAILVDFGIPPGVLFGPFLGPFWDQTWNSFYIKTFNRHMFNGVRE